MYTPQLSDFKVVDLQGLRMLCLERARLCPNVLWAPDELEVSHRIFRKHVKLFLDQAVSDPAWAEIAAEREKLQVSGPRVPDWREVEGFTIFVRDIEETAPEHEMPKWTALASWLAPESIAGSAPSFISELAQWALFESAPT